MMTSLVALCADVASVRYPETMGLAGENLATQTWLRLFTSAEEARAFLREDQLVDEVWVVSSEEVAPINLAATLKSDRPDRSVCLVSFEGTGSLRSRMNTARIDACLTRQSLAARYAKRKRAAQEQVAETAQTPPISEASLKTLPAIQADAIARDQAIKSLHQPVAQSCVATPAWLLSVVSGSGGAGKSTIAALCALISQRQGRRTLLLDFDLQFGDMAALLGVEHPLAIDELLATPSRIDQLQPDGALPALLAPPKHLEQAEAVVGHAAEVIDQLRARFDVIVANTGAGWSEQHAVLLERSSKALFLVDQRPSSLRACKRALDVCARCGIASTPFTFAVNRCGKGALFTSIDVSCALQGVHVAELADGGFEVEELLGTGLPAELLASHNNLCVSVEQLLHDLLPSSPDVSDAPLTAKPRGLRLRWGARSSRRKRKEATCHS